MASLTLFQIAYLLFYVLGAVAQGTPGVRKEWRTLTSSEKSDYIRAVKCLRSKKSVLAESGNDDERRTYSSLSRFDDIVLVHIRKTPNIHNNGQFLPWHRYFTLLHETLLRRECDYKGYQPYWDQSLDVPPQGNWIDSPLFDPVTGFGGNGLPVDVPEDFIYFGFDMTPLSLTGEGPVTDVRGNALVQSILPLLAATRTGGGCITDGPFKDLQIKLGPNNSTSSTPRCLNRDFAPGALDFINLPNVLEIIWASESYADLLQIIEFAHGVGHAGVGGLIGEMDNLFSSPNDPLFFLHHAGLDRTWWKWQSLNLTSRLTDISGFAFSTGDETVTLDFPLDLGFFGLKRPIKDFMDIRKLGYVYAN